MRMGLTNFILPFLFVLTPTLILRGDTSAILLDVTSAIVAVWLMASAFEGWLYYVGRIEWISRAPLLVAAMCFLLPSFYADLVGVVILAAVFVFNGILKKPDQAAA